MQADTSSTTDSLLEVEDLVVEFSTDEGVVRAVDGVSLSIPRGGTLGVVGESGCGKSVTALSIMRLIPRPPGRVVRGRVIYNGVDLLKLDDEAMRRLRGHRISMIFQEPMTSLNPVFTVGEQIGEALRLHLGLDRRAADRRSVELLALVGIPAPEERLKAYPHQLSGGMRQRVMIAMALSCGPDLLIADEPTTALDVTIQAQIMDLLASLQAELGMSVMLITHDLGVVAESCDVVQVMYAGRVVETAPVRALFASPAHPYTLGLLRSVPGYRGGLNDEDPVGADGRRRLRTIPGLVPNLLDLPAGCRFQARCQFATEACGADDPPLIDARGDQRVACIHPVPSGASS